MLSQARAQAPCDWTSPLGRGMVGPNRGRDDPWTWGRCCAMQEGHR